MPKISVVIPSYNNASYIAEAVESVLNQTFKDFEIIVVDDGSNDNTKEVLKPYIDKELVRYFYQENQGPGAARNRGILSARGDYIAFLDSDDLLTKESLEKRVKLIENEPELGLVFSNNYFKAKDSNRVEVYSREFSGYLSKFMVRRKDGVIFNGTFEEIGEVYFQIWTGTVLVRKKVFEETGLFRTDIVRGEDSDMWGRITMKYKIGFIESSLAYYNHFRGFLTSGEPLQYCLDRLKWYDQLLVDHYNRKRICNYIRKGIAITYSDLGSYYLNQNLRIKFIINYLKSFYYQPFGNTYRYKFFLAYFVHHKLKRLIKKH